MTFLAVLFALKLHFSMVTSSESVLDTECGLTGVTVAVVCLNPSYTLYFTTPGQTVNS